MHVGELARISGVSADTLRHYERKGLLKPRRSPNGYREYPSHAVDRVKLIRSALAIGFKLDDLARVLKVRDAGGAPCRQVRAIAEVKLDEIETLVREATAMRDGLRKLLNDWDEQTDSVAADEPARLLESLAALGFAGSRALARLKSPGLKHKQMKEGK